MADKLDWMNQHLILLRYTSLDEVVEQENYKIRPDLAELFVGVTSGEAMVQKFARLERWKCAGELMAYLAHRRAGVWWGYRCVLSLLEELRIKPPEDRDIADIGGDFTPTVPDFAKVAPPKATPEDIALIESRKAEVEAKVKELRAQVDPEMMSMMDEGMEIFYTEFEKAHGIRPLDLIKKLADRAAEDPHPIDPASPIFQEAAKIKAQVKAIRKETVDTIKSVIPPKMPEHEKMIRDNALDAVYRWVVSPDEENSKKCLEIGNECPDTPAGLLSLSAFWAFGNLMPGGKEVVPTPPGLAANGLCQVMLMCALHKGGTRKLGERYEHYFDLGVEVLTGRDHWEESLQGGEAPHKANFPQTGSTQENPAAGEYHRWKPT